MNATSVQNKTFTNYPISNGVLGMMMLILTELMFFSGLISAYIVHRTGVTDWPPAGQPRLPVEVTAINTLLLLMSGASNYMIAKQYKTFRNARIWLALTMVLGTVFIIIQGYEWSRLIGYGLTTSSSIYGACFYAIIGMHAFHVFLGLCLLYYLWNIMHVDMNRENTQRKINACSLFWYFVVGIWPVLYVLVYLI